MGVIDPFRALIIDDDNFVRPLLARQLLMLGASEVADVDDAQRGMAMLVANGPFDLVLCDLQMPEMDGIMLLRALAELKPAPAVILVSSADQQVLDVARQVAEGRHLRLLAALQKPVLAASLRDAINRLRAPVAARRIAAAAIEVTADELRQALEAGEMGIHVQPKLDMTAGALTGVEVLARWTSPTRGVIPPATFIPLAESAGLIGLLTERVLELGLDACQQWHAAGLDISVAINLSLASLTDLSFPGTLEAQVRARDLAPSQIVLEITESMVLENLVETLDILGRLRLKGFRLSIDDFGTGYSSLLQLRRLPFTELKIDRAFASAVMVDDTALSIIKSCIELARSLKLSVVAEGIESRAEWDLLRGLGCGVAQGYFIARPMPPQQLLEWWRSRPPMVPANGVPTFAAGVAGGAAGEAAFERLFAVSNDAILLIDGRGRIRRHNLNAQALFGYTGPELDGQSVEMLVPRTARGDHASVRGRFQESARMRGMSEGRSQVRAMRRDGTEFPVSILLNPVRHENEGMTLAVVRDCTRKL